MLKLVVALLAVSFVCSIPLKDVTPTKVEDAAQVAPVDNVKAEKVEAKAADTETEKVEAKVEAKTDKVEAKAEKVEAKVEKVEAKAEKVEAKAEKAEAKVEAKADKVEAKTEKVETKVEAKAEKVEAEAKEVEKVEAKADKEEAKVEAKSEKKEDAKKTEIAAEKVDAKTEEVEVSEKVQEKKADDEHKEDHGDHGDHGDKGKHDHGGDGGDGGNSTVTGDSTGNSTGSGAAPQSKVDLSKAKLLGSLVQTFVGEKEFADLLRTGSEIIAQAEKRAKEIESRLSEQNLLQSDGLLGLKEDGTIDANVAVDQITSLVGILTGTQVTPEEKNSVHDVISTVTQVINPMLSTNSSEVAMPDFAALGKLFMTLGGPDAADLPIQQITSVMQMLLTQPGQGLQSLLDLPEEPVENDAIGQLASAFLNAFDL